MTRSEMLCRLWSEAEQAVAGHEAHFAGQGEPTAASDYTFQRLADAYEESHK